MIYICSQSSELSGNKKNPALNVDGKPDKLHYMVYKADDIKNNADVSLTRGGMILFAMLSGGDYSKVSFFVVDQKPTNESCQGLEGFGPVISYALARCGFGDELLSACQNLPPVDLREYLAYWRVCVNTELRENKKRFLRHRTNLVLPDSFPSVDILEKYAKPITSKLQGSSGSTALRDRSNLDLASLATFCEKNFEWGSKKTILERFRKVIWPCTVMHVLRRSALESDQRPAMRNSVGTSTTIVKRYLDKESPLERVRSAFVNQGMREDTAPEVGNFPSLILRITTSRQHASTDNILEYRIEVSPPPDRQHRDLRNQGNKTTAS
jgi:Holliday junction resolvase YEN1